MNPKEQHICLMVNRNYIILGIAQYIKYYFFVEKKLINAAEDVANTIGGDKKTMSDLLQKVLASRMEALKEQQLQTNGYVNYDMYYIPYFIFKSLVLT